MSFIHPVIADADRPLDSKFFVDDIVAPVDTFFSEHFKIDWKINIIVTTSLPWLIIPEDGVGGKTYASDFVILAINQKNTVVAKASEMFAHELAHAIRWGKNPEQSKNLFSELVSEGLAVHIEAEFAKTQKNKTFFLETVLARNDEENCKMLKALRSKLDAEVYDYNSIFFGGGEWPRWAGYCVGYYIVKKYLEKTKKEIFEVIGDSYEDFRTCIT